MTTDLAIFLVVLSAGAVTGVVIGILVAPLVGRLADRTTVEDEGERSDEPD
jgi:hypothetical protein